MTGNGPPDDDDRPLFYSESLALLIIAALGLGGLLALIIWVLRRL